MGGIFVSYRRDDSRYAAGRFYDKLVQHFGEHEVFMDVVDIQAGQNFVEELNARLATCSVLVAIVGRHWLKASDEGGAPRLEDPNDFVRREIEIALERKLRVVPVLVDGAKMPRVDQLPSTLREFAERQAVTLTHATFGLAMGPLIDVLRMELQPEKKQLQSKKWKVLWWKNG